MSLKRISPVSRQFNLGSFRFTRDELAEIVRLLCELPNVEVNIESDKNTLTDIADDLPQLGARVSYLIITAKRTEDGRPHSKVLEIIIDAGGCSIKTEDPDPVTLGYIELIKSAAEPSRRVPRWVRGIFRTDPVHSYRYSEGEFSAKSFPGLVGIASLVIGGLSIASIIQRTGTGKNAPTFAWPLSPVLLAVSVIVFTLVVVGYAASRTVIYTSTRAATPTFWRRHRFDIAIHIVVGAIFFVLGLLVGHG